MRSATIILLLLIVLGVIACDQNAEVSQEGFVEALISSEPLQENWREIVEIGEPQFFGVEEPADHPLAWISPIHLAPGPENGIVVLEDREPDIKLVHPEKGVITTYGKGRGSGPGEFQNTTSSVWVPGTGILVRDGPNQRITVFTEAGVYVRDIHPPRTCSILAFSNGHLWASPSISNVIDRAFIIDIKTGEILREVGGRYMSAPWAESYMTRCSLTGSRFGILLAVKYPYEIHAYDSGGDLQRIFGREAKWLGPPEELSMGSFGSSYSPKGGQVGRANYFPIGVVIVSLYKSEPIGTTSTGFPLFDTTLYFDLFTQDGEWLTTIPSQDLLPDNRIGIWTIATDGAFWGVVFGDYQRIVRLQLSFKQPY